MAFERKFKDGDKVRVCYKTHVEYGKVGEIICFIPCCGYLVKHGIFRRYYQTKYLEKVGSNTPIDTITNRIILEDLRPGYKVKLGEITYCGGQKLKLSNTIQTISKIRYSNIFLENYPNLIFYHYDFAKIIEFSEESSNELYIGDWVINKYPNHSKYGEIGRIISYRSGNESCDVHFKNNTRHTINIKYLEKVKPEESSSPSINPVENSSPMQTISLPLKEGQVVTLLDGKKYQVCTSKDCNGLFCCAKCQVEKCEDSYIQGAKHCRDVLPFSNCYFKLITETTHISNTESIPSRKGFTLSEFTFSSIGREKRKLL